MRWLYGIFCWLSNMHSFDLPPGDPDTTQVAVNTLACSRCGKDFLELMSNHTGVSREQMFRQFTHPVMRPVSLSQSVKDEVGAAFERRQEVVQAIPAPMPPPTRLINPSKRPQSKTKRLWK